MTMGYVDGFLVAVPAENKDAYRAMAEKALPLFREFGVSRLVECWEDDVPDGKVTDFRRAVKAKDGEIVCFSWMEYPSREARDAAQKKMMSDPRMEAFGQQMPFDGMRMVFGGFAPIVDDGAANGIGYADGYVLAIPSGNKDAYHAMAAKAAAIFQEYGASRVVEAWSDDVPAGKVTDFYMAVQAKDGEDIVFSWVEWPSKQARDEGMAKVMADERMKPGHDTMPFDGQRMIFGGFAPIVDA